MNEVIKDISEKAKILMNLKKTYEKAEEAFKQAEKQYNTYRCVTLPALMQMNGVNALTLDDGTKVGIADKFYCSPNKNDLDQNTMVNWLRDNGGDDLVKSEAHVDKAFIAALKQTSIPFVEQTKVNTNSLKAWLRAQLGADGGVAQIQMADIPECMHFTEVSECTIDSPNVG